MEHHDLNPTRRSLLKSMAAASSLRCVPAVPLAAGALPDFFDQPDKPVRADGHLLPTPDFDRLRASVQFKSGIRPHRRGGVRLERDAEFEQQTPGRFLIHNYGHGGAGITLSWGCASVVKDLVADIVREWPRGRSVPVVAILGGGVMGLTVADEVRRLRPKLAINIYRRERSVAETTSYIAGGQFEPSQIWHEYGNPEGPKLDVLTDYLVRSHAKIQRLQALPDGGRHRYGVARRPNYTLDQDNDSFGQATPCSVVPHYRRGLLPFKHLNVVGRQYETWLMNPKYLLPQMVRDLSVPGIQFRQKSFTSQADVKALRETIVVNCLGYGAKQVFGDAQLRARSGHLAVLRNPARLGYFFSGGCVARDGGRINAYMFARQDDIVIGGTVYKDDDREQRDTDLDRRIGALLADNMRLVFEGRPEDCVRPPSLPINGADVAEG